MRATWMCLGMLGLALGGCGSSHGADAGDGGGSDSGRVDSGRDARPDTAVDSSVDGTVTDTGDDCATAVEGGECATAGTFCGGPCPDPCQFCNLLQCDGAVWQRLEAFPAPCFDCGEGLQCIENDAYCWVELSDTSAPDQHECRNTPEACGGTATCGCISPTEPGECDDSQPGQVTVTTGGA